VLKQDWRPERVEKFRRAGFVYLHVAILYEAAVYAMLQAGALPARFGPPLVWLIAGAAVSLSAGPVSPGRQAPVARRV